MHSSATAALSHPRRPLLGNHPPDKPLHTLLVPSFAAAFSPLHWGTSAPSTAACPRPPAPAELLQRGAQASPCGSGRRAALTHDISPRPSLVPFICYTYPVGWDDAVRVSADLEISGRSMTGVRIAGREATNRPPPLPRGVGRTDPVRTGDWTSVLHPTISHPHRHLVSAGRDIHLLRTL